MLCLSFNESSSLRLLLIFIEMQSNKIKNRTAGLSVCAICECVSARCAVCANGREHNFMNSQGYAVERVTWHIPANYHLMVAYFFMATLFASRIKLRFSNANPMAHTHTHTTGTSWKDDTKKPTDFFSLFLFFAFRVNAKSNISVCVCVLKDPLKWKAKI